MTSGTWLIGEDNVHAVCTCICDHSLYESARLCKQAALKGARPVLCCAAGLRCRVVVVVVVVVVAGHGYSQFAPDIFRPAFLTGTLAQMT